MNESEWTSTEVVEVGKWQKCVIWLLLFQVISLIFFFVIADLPKDSIATRASADIIGLLAMIGRIVLAVFSLYCVYKMAVSLKKGSPLLYAVGMLFPLVCLLVLAHLSAEATRILQKNGVHVGVMGADQADLERLVSTSMSI